MARLRDLPIKWKLTAASLATCTVSLVVAGAIFFAFDYMSFRRQLIHRAAALAQVVGANSTAALTFRDSEVATETLSAVRHEWHVLSAVLYDAADRPVASYSRDDAPVATAPPVMGVDDTKWQPRQVCVSKPVQLEGETIGRVVLAFSRQPLRARILRYGALVLIVLAVCFTAAWLLSLNLQSRVAGPILQLKETAEQITRDGDFSVRVREETQDEIGALVQGFNAMLGQIETRDEELQRYQDKLRSLASQLVVTEEEERRRIAVGLHDSICQLLWAANLRLKMLHRQEIANEIVDELREAEDLITDALTETRSLSFQLSPPALHELGLGPALHELAEEVGEQYGLPVHVNATDLDHQPSAHISILLYRAARELIINSCKHAHASSASIDMAGSDHRIQIAVSDDGVGFDPEQDLRRRDSGGFGLFSIRERLHDIGGKMEVTTAPEQGTKITIEAPLPADEPPAAPSS